ncbi:MAG: molecular chaperone DnaK [Myxococcales bacterium]|nr:molecular chaperone DnaK [Myxococcales bacterium]|tara:strand:+ start:649 stop:2457 length:1809 start_codon:yes stop_codon:yes gene_type:complete
MGKVIGIDLGTTNSCVSVVEAGNPLVMPNSEGSRITPSVVAFSEDGQRLVGHVAKRQAVTNPESTIFGIKRLMGRKSEMPEVQKLNRIAPYHIEAQDNGDAAVVINDRNYSPPEITAVIMQEIRSVAEGYLGEAVTQAVVTVPAYFDDTQRQATRDAGRIAGLEVLRIINEPTAAALAYGLNRGAKGRVAVYDFGGGTFDISILEVGDGVFQVKATHGDTFLGGRDLDNRIADRLLREFQDMHGVDLREDPVAMQRIIEAAEVAKIELSSSQETEINLPFIYSSDEGPKHLQFLLTRDEMESLVEDLIDKTVWHCEEALNLAEMKNSELDEVILVGGMTKMPMIQRKVSSFFNAEPHRDVNPDEAVAIGAAIQGAILTGEIQDVLLLDVIPLSLGIETRGAVFTKLIERNRTIPTSCTEVFTTAEDYQTIVNIHVLQGERPMAQDNKSLARFELVGLPPARRGIPKIEVTFQVDVNGILHVHAKDLGTGNEQSVRVRPTSGLTEANIQSAIEESQQFDSDDSMKKELAEIKNRLEGLVYTTEKSLTEFVNYLTDEELEQITKDMQEARAALDTDAQDRVRAAMAQLEKSSYRIAEVMYQGGE